jgi:hypothetical protein
MNLKPIPISMAWVQELEALRSSLDPSQHTALAQALKHRVALIQGPPGTGKTFIGVQLCDIILKHSQETILCVCYTNHALDQFLEALLDKGITNIVRIGSRSRSDRMEQYNMRQLVKQQQGGLSRIEGRRMYNIMEEVRQTEAEVKRLGGLLSSMAKEKQLKEWEAQQQRAQQQQRRRSRQQGELGKPVPDRPQQQQKAKQKGDEQPFDEWVAALGSFLKSRHPSFWEQLRVPREFPKEPSYLWVRWKAGAKGRGVVDKWIQKRQADQLPVDGRRVAAGIKSSKSAGQVGGEDIWELPLAAREGMIASWKSTLCEEWATELAEHLETANKLQQEVWGLHDGAYEKVLAGAKVIGCTTTGAAMVKGLLSSAKVAPG